LRSGRINGQYTYYDKVMRYIILLAAEEDSIELKHVLQNFANSFRSFIKYVFLSLLYYNKE